MESDHTALHHLEAIYSSHIEISGCYFHHAPSYGGGGHGYGLVLYGSSTNCLVENNIFNHLRHAMVSGGGANCNVWTYNYSREQVCEGSPPTYRDLDLHSKYPYASLYEQNWVVTIGADNEFGNNGDDNAFVRNYCFDDENNEWGYIHLLNAPNSSVLGCEVSGPTGGVDGGGSTSFAIEKYGRFSDGSIPIEDYDLMPWKNHYQVYLNVAYRMGSYLLDLSYYYSSVPQFVEDAGLSFPSLGPNWYWHSQNIPARQRWYSGNIKTYNPYPTTSITTSGTLTKNENWRGEIHLTGNVIVPAGISLNILPNAQVISNGPYELRVDPSSQFTANHASFDQVRYIRVKSNNTSIEDCSISNAVNYGIYIQNASPTIKNCTFTTCPKGIYIYGNNANPIIEECEILASNTEAIFVSTDADPAIHNNKLSSSGDQTIKIYNGDGEFKNNTIESTNGDGVYIYGSTSEPDFRGVDNGDGNYWDNCEQNYIVASGGDPWLGWNSTNCYGYNVLDDNGFGDHYIENYLGFTLLAEQNWWTSIDNPGGGYPSDGSGFFGYSTDYIPACTRPTQAGALWKPSTTDDDSTSEEFLEAFDQYENKDFTASISELRSLIEKYPSHKLAPKGLFILCKSYLKIDALKVNTSILNDIIFDSIYDASLKHVARAWLMRNEIIKGKIQDAEKIAFNAPSGSNSERDLLLTVISEYVRYGDRNSAERVASILMERRKNNPDENRIEKDIKIALSIEHNVDADPLKKSNLDSDIDKDAFVNYPNPFNSSTAITFKTKQSGMAEMHVFNTLGQKVKTLLKMNLQEGIHQIIWDGKDEFNNCVGSGVYFVRLQIADSHKTLKISLLK